MHDELIDVPNAPNIPGLKFRHFLGEVDYPQMAKVLMESDGADQIERIVKPEDLAKAYQQLSNCDPTQDMIFAEVAGELVGYNRGWWRDDSLSGKLYLHNGFLVPAWRRKGIGTAMLHWTESRLKDIAATHPPEQEKHFQVDVSQFQEGTVILLERTGYQPVRYFYEMVRPDLEGILDYPLAEGLEIRSVTSDQYQAIWKLVDETSQDEWGYVEPTEKAYQEWLADPHFQPHLWQIAWDVATNRVVGTVLTYIDHDVNKQLNRKRGFTEGIGVNRVWRRRGVARALISRSLGAQKAAGMTESALAADSESISGVTRLYESCGFEIVTRNAIYRKPI
jgi:GNAT superfamily N-acetyltransferase